MRRWRLLSKLPIFTQSYRRQTHCQLAVPCVNHLNFNCLMNRMAGRRNFKRICRRRRKTPSTHAPPAAYPPDTNGNLTADYYIRRRAEGARILIAVRIFSVAASRAGRPVELRSNSTGRPNAIVARLGLINAGTISLPRCEPST